MRIYAVIEIDHPNSKTFIQDKLEELMKFEGIVSVKSTTNKADFDKSFEPEYTPLQDEDSWRCIAGAAEA